VAIVVTERRPTNSAVIVRLDRTIQYAAADVSHLKRLRLLDTRWSLSSGSPKARPDGGYDEKFRPAAISVNAISEPAALDLNGF
jgi:hypothetical protein